MLIKHFADQEQHVFYLRKGSRGGVRRFHPSRIFYELDSNTYTSIDGKKRREVEDALSKLESAVDPIVCRIVDCSITSRRLELTKAEKRKIAEFIIALYKRSPSIRAQYSSLEFVRSSLDESIGELKNAGIEVSSPVRDKIYSHLWLSEAMKQASVQATLLHTEEYVERICRKGVRFARPSYSNKSFILGSVPFLQLKGIDSAGFSDAKSEFWLPIAPSVAIVFFGEEDILDPIPLQSQHVRFINLEVWRQSNAAAAASRELLMSLAASR